ncbi:MAG: DUF4342 domain-containing protein [Hornefia sp.]|nr:DUF4342 domain-containing protein [Hornefia sp.]
MEITLEKIELVKDRTGVTYKEAKGALEKADGNVVDAIILLENEVDDTSSQKIGARGEHIISRIKEVIKRGNIAKIVIRRNDEVILNVPLNIGVLGAVIAPWGMLIGVLAAFSFKCQIELLTDRGDIIDITDKAGNLYDEAVTRGTEFYDDIKEKAPAVYETVKEKSEDAVNKAKEVAKSGAEMIIPKAAEEGKDDELEDDHLFQDIGSTEAVTQEFAEEAKESAEAVSEGTKEASHDANYKVKSALDIAEEKAKEASEEAQEALKSETTEAKDSKENDENELKRFKFF